MAKNKKELTTTQKQRKYRTIEKATFISEFVALAMPYGIMCGVNFDNWFVHETGWKVAIGGISAIALLFISVLSVIKDEDTKPTRKQRYLTLLLRWVIAAFVLYCLADILTQICNIMIFGALGIAGALGLDITSAKYKNLADLYKTSRENDKKKQVEREIEEERERLEGKKNTITF